MINKANWSEIWIKLNETEIKCFRDNQKKKWKLKKLQLRQNWEKTGIQVSVVE